MRRRLRTTIVVMTAVSVVLAISIPVASAHRWGRSDRYNRGRWFRHSTTTVSPAKTSTTTTQPARQDPVTTAPTTTTAPPTTTTAPTTTTRPATGNSSSRPASGGYFSVLPPGSALPSGAECAARVHHSSWEPRHDNDVANHTPVVNTLGSFSQWNSAWNTNYKPRVDGAFQGTTDEIIQWAACKWGWSDELIRAEAVVESTWHQSTVGDNGTSYGLMQVRYLYHPRVQNGCKACLGSSWPNSENSTAFNVDLFGAEMRGCYNGMSTYLGNTTGDIWGCIGSWYSGAWHDGGAQSYIGWVQSSLSNKPWLNWAG
jgi:hypothetical protein